MSESEGLHKLTQYLNQTRKQAELSIDILNNKIIELNNENKQYQDIIQELISEKDHYKLLVDKLKYENTTKHKLQERDDWKSLIDNVQKDRNRIQDECILLKTELEETKYELSRLHEQMNDKIIDYVSINSNDIDNNINISTKPSTPLSSAKKKKTNLNILIDNSYDNISEELFTDTIIDRHGKEIKLPESPKAIIKQLKIELKRCYLEIESECQKSEKDRLSYLFEISQLKEELRLNCKDRITSLDDSIDNNSYNRNKYNSNYIKNHSNNTILTNKSSNLLINKKKYIQPSGLNWLIDLVFSNNSSGNNASIHKDKVKIIHV